FSPVNFELATGSSGLNDCTVIQWSTKRLLLEQNHSETQPKNKSFENQWKLLGNSDPKRSLASLNHMRIHPQQTLEYLETKFGSRRLETEQISNWIAELDSTLFSVREQATHRLIERRWSAEQHLKSALETSTSPEVKSRLSRILKQSVFREAINDAEQRRLHRCIFLLELVGSDEKWHSSCIELLESIAESSFQIGVTRDALKTASRLRQSKQK
ncbi:MAG: hypothetical protein AAGA30_21140, partial [Planctomycetota bacterium]